MLYSGNVSDANILAATDSAISALDLAQSKYDAYLHSYNSVQYASVNYMKDQSFTSQADWDVLSAIQKLPRDISGLKPSAEQAAKISAALAAFGSGAGVMVENNTFVVNTAESVHKAAEVALAVGGASQLAYFGVKVLTEQGLAACARQAAVMVAASTAVNFGSQQAVALAQEHGVNPDYIRIGADALQVVMLWKAAKLQRQGCFVAGTQVLVEYDDQGQPLTRNIEELRVGDQVLSRSQSDEADDLDLRTITAVSKHEVYQLQMVVVSDRNGNIETLESTVEHPYYVEGKGWTRADELEAGDRAMSDSGMQRTVMSSVAEEKPDGVTVYNLTVEEDHTYFVEDGAGSQEFVWVHNGACDGEPRRPVQSSGHTLSNHAKGVLSRKLGVDPNKLKNALESLKREAGLQPDDHGKIWSNGDFTSKDGSIYYGNIADYLS